MIAYGRPFWPIFLHVLGAMTLVGAVLTAAVVAWAAWRRSSPVLARTAFRVLVFVGVPAYVVMRVFAQILASDEGFKGNADPAWIGIGLMVADLGLLLLLLTTGFAFWWQRSGKIGAGRTVSVLTSVYLVLLAIAWFAMSAKWG